MSGIPDTFAARHASLEGVLTTMRDPQERLAWVVERAGCRAEFPGECRVEAHLVKGCAARFWLMSRAEDGRCRFACDSDSAILKAVGGLLCDLYDGLPAGEVADSRPEFLGRTGLLAQFTENRRKTIRRVHETICQFARAMVEPPTC